MRLPRHFAPRNDNNQPKQYKQGFTEFYKLKFKVTPDTLIPRPETELLVDEVLSFVSHLPTTNYQLLTTILDLGTGAGNIAISIAKNLPAGRQDAPNVKVIATEISPKALKVAKQNAKLHGVQNQIEFIRSDLLSSVIPAPYQVRGKLAGIHLTTCDSELDPDFRRDDKVRNEMNNLIVVTNLPYIPSARIPYLDSSVKDFEPRVALDGGEDGFELYRKLFQQIKKLGWKPKLLLGEIDYTHGELAAIEAQKYFPEAEIEVKKDLAHLQRILFISNR